MTTETYVEERDGRAYFRGSRVPLTALAALWSDGASPEAIVEAGALCAACSRASVRRCTASGIFLPPVPGL